MKKTLTILKSLIEPEIISHIKTNFDYDTYKHKVDGLNIYYQTFESKFNFTCEGRKFKAIITFAIEDGKLKYNEKDDIEVTDIDGITYSVGNDEDRFAENQLIIKTCSQNPNKQTIYDFVETFVEQEENKRKQ